jgi:hypothetical protein
MIKLPSGRTLFFRGVKIVQAWEGSPPLVNTKDGAQWAEKAYRIGPFALIDCSTSPRTPKRNWWALIRMRNISQPIQEKLGLATK